MKNIAQMKQTSHPNHTKTSDKPIFWLPLWDTACHYHILAQLTSLAHCIVETILWWIFYRTPIQKP